MNHQIPAKFIERLNTILEYKHITQPKLLTLKLGVSEKRINSYLNGNIIPRRAIGTKLAKALEVKVEWLYGEEG